jgi:hypothetical protein
MLEAHASNTDGFLASHRYVFSTELSWAIWSKQSLSPSLYTKLQEVVLEKLTQFSLGSNAIDTAAFNTDGFHSRDTCGPAT